MILQRKPSLIMQPRASVWAATVQVLRLFEVTPMDVGKTEKMNSSENKTCFTADTNETDIWHWHEGPKVWLYQPDNAYKICGAPDKQF